MGGYGNVMAVALLIAGCGTDLPDCATPTRADRVVFARDGTPMFEGQALLTFSCGLGRCHSSFASERERNGAPAGFDFNLSPACDLGTDCTQLDALRDRARNVRRRRHLIYESLDHIALDRVLPAYQVFEDGALASPLPSITSDEGRQIVGEWLACGAAVVEVVARNPDLRRTFPGERCDDEAGERRCVYPARTDPPEPQWGGDNGIYQRVIVELGCVSYCHRDNDNLTWDQHQLDLCLASPELEDECDPDAVLASLVDGTASGISCSEEVDPGSYIVAGDAYSSFFLNKLGTEPICGEPMPSSNGIPPAFIAPIAEWIDAGASATVE